MSRSEVRAAARGYVYSAIGGALEMGQYDPLMMKWEASQHDAVMAEVGRIRDRFKPKRRG